MPLTVEEWRAFANEHNAAMTDVEADLRATLDGLGAILQGLVERDMLSPLEADSLRESLREALLRAQGRLNAHTRRVVQMREEGEL